MSKKDSSKKSKAEITPDFILGEQKKLLLKIAEVLSDHIGEVIISD
jgi:hypothetical protein